METRAVPPNADRSRRPANGVRRFCAGFSLIELMVAMVIGLLGIVVMMQVFSVFEGQKRTTTGGDDAISSGSVALYGVERAIKQSGWGLSAPQLIGCTATGVWSAVAGAPTIAVPLFPVSVNSALISGQDDGTDTLLVVSGNGNGTVEGDVVNSLSAPTSYAVHTPSAFVVGERVLAAPKARPLPCNLVLTRVSGIVAPNVNVAGAAAYGVASGDRLFNLGAAPTVRGYAVRGGNLTACEFTTVDCSSAANWISIADNVVSLRAQYGRDSNAIEMDGAVDVWNQSLALPVTPSAEKNTLACALYRISALRIALVARNSQPEKPLAGGAHVTPTTPVWAGSDDLAVGVDASAAADVAFALPSPDPAWPTWRDFRYKVFQTVVPLRNVISMDALIRPPGGEPAC